MIIEKKRTVVSFTVMIFAAIVFLISDPPWTTPGSATAYYSVLAFLLATIAASVYNIMRADPSPANRMFFSGTLYALTIFAGAAIFYLVSMEDPVIHTTTSGIFLNLVAMASTGVFILLFSWFKIKSPSENSIWNKSWTGTALALIFGLLFVFSMFIVRQPFGDLMFLVLGYSTGLLSVFIYLFSSYLVYKRRESIRYIDPYRLALSFLLMTGASAVHILILPSPSSLWILSICFMAISFVFAIIALAYPYLVDIGVEKNQAYLFTLSISLLVLVPFVITQLVEVWTSPTAFPDLGATIVIHLGGAVLAGASAYGLFIKTQKKSTLSFNPIVLLLTYWSVSEISLIILRFTPLYVLGDESTLPYICGTIFSAILLTFASRQVLSPSDKTVSRGFGFYILAGLVFIFLIALVEVIQWNVLSQVPSLRSSQIGTAIMLGLSYLALYALLNLTITIVGRSGGAITFETIASALPSVWIVIVILKVNFSTWTPGWWTAEVFLLLNVTLHSLMLLFLYLSESEKELDVMSVQSYSEILSERIAIHHKTVIDSLEKISKESVDSESTLVTVSDALSHASRAEALTSHLSSLLSGNTFSSEELETMDLVDIISKGIGRVKIPGKTTSEILTISHDTGYCFVKANQLLIGSITGLVTGSISRFGHLSSVDAAIVYRESGKWQVRLTISLVSTDAESMANLFRRYADKDFSGLNNYVYARRILQLYGSPLKTDVETDRDERITLMLCFVLEAVLEK